MKKHTLNASPREIVGKKVKQVRALGMVPGNIYGKKVKSVSVAVSQDAFKKIYAEAGETGLVELHLDSPRGEAGKDIRPVLIHHVQVDPVTGVTVHVEFFQVDLKEKVHAKVPLELVGESPAVAQRLGVLLTVHDEVEVEALPADLPEKIIVDVSTLVEVNEECKVSDLKVPSGVTLLSDAALTLVKVGSLVTKEAEAQAAEEAAAAAASAATAEGSAPAEGAEKATEKSAQGGSASGGKEEAPKEKAPES